MPKIATINPNTGAKLGDTTFQGRTIQVKTNANPTYLNSYNQTPPSGEPAQIGSVPPQEGHLLKGDEITPEAKSLDPVHEALAKKESALRARERDFQAREAAFKAREAELDAAKAFKDRLKSSPLDVLNELGVTYDQLVEQAVNYPDQTTRTLQAKLDAIEAKQKSFDEESKKAQDSQREAAVKQIRFDVQDLIEADPEFETIKHTGSIDDVVDLIVKTFDETGRMMGSDQAAKLVENELLEEAIKISQLAKVKARNKPELSPELVATSKQQSRQPATTLTNSMTSKRPMTARERAISVFNEGLKRKP